MIKRIALSNFKSLKQVPTAPARHLELSPINVLIGPNGSGKSSFLQAIDFLRAFFMSSVELYLQDRAWNYRDLPNLRHSSKTIRWELQAELPSDAQDRCRGTYTCVVTLSPKRYLGVGQEYLEYAPIGREPVPLLRRKGRTIRRLNRITGKMEQLQEIGLPASVMSRLHTPEDKSKFPEQVHFRNWVESFRAFLLWDPKVLRMPDRGKHDVLGPSGEHLAPLLARLKRERSAGFRKLMRRIRRLFPTVSDISFEGGRGWGWKTLRLHESDGRTVTFNSRQMSDGVLRLLAVTSLLYLDRVPPVVTFEEPENGVHPQLIREVVQVLRELTLRKHPNRCQVLFTTHSPYVLDEFYDHPEQVFLVERGRPQESASITRLCDRGQIEVVREAFDHSLGEAWATGLLGAGAGTRR